MLLEPINAAPNEQAMAFNDLRTRLIKKNLKALEFICKDLSCCPNGTKGQRRDYAAALVDWHRNQPLSSPTSASNKSVVDDAVILRIRRVIRDLVRPSWLRSLPSDLSILFGTKGAGSLKADEWRTFFTIVLPIALVSLWGEGLCDSRAHCREILDHTMTLVSAVLVAGTHHTTPRRADAYLKYMKQYVSQLHRLYPHVEPRTNEHVAFHIYDFLLAYGPIRSWWCFPFERLVGVLQNLPSNHRIGKTIISYVR